MLLFLIENNTGLTYSDIQLLSPQKTASTGKNISGFIITWSIMQCYANFIGDR